MQRKRITIGALTITWSALAVLSGCSSDSSADRSNASTAEMANAAQDEFAATEAAAADTGAPAAKPAADIASIDVGAVGDGAGPSAAAQRKIISTGEITLQANDVSRVAEQVRTAVVSVGGFVESERTKTIPPTFNEQGKIVLQAKTSSTTLRLRVPANRFDRVQNDLSSLATVIEKSLGSEDVTSEVVDVQSRITSLRTSIARMQVLFDKAETIADVALVEGELSRRQSDLESMLARQKELANLTSLGTITLTVQSPDQFVGDPVEEKGVLDGLKRGVRAVGIVGVGLATALAFLLPFLVVGAVLFVPVRLLLRRVRRLVNRRSGRRSVPGVKGAKQPNTTDPAPPLG